MNREENKFRPMTKSHVKKCLGRALRLSQRWSATEVPRDDLWDVLQIVSNYLSTAAKTIGKARAIKLQVSKTAEDK